MDTDLNFHNSSQKTSHFISKKTYIIIIYTFKIIVLYKKYVYHIHRIRHKNLLLIYKLTLNIKNN